MVMSHNLTVVSPEPLARCLERKECMSVAGDQS